jgi:hypothetical protein
MIDKSGAPAAPMMMPIPHNLGRCDRKACAGESTITADDGRVPRADDANRVSVSRFDSGQKNTFSDGR